MDTGLFGSLVRSYRRYGPGRLPLAERPTVGAGYAGACAALGVGLLFVAVTGGAALLPGPAFETDVYAVAALLALPLVVPAAFAAGVLTWRYLPADGPRFGAVAGVVAAVLAYALAGVAFALVFALAETARTLSTLPAPAAAEVVIGAAEAFGFGALVAVVALVVSSWLALPVGALAGYVHERSRRDEHGRCGPAPVR